MAVLGLLRLLLPLLLILLLYSPVRCAPCCCSDGPDHFLKPSAATKRGGGLSLGLVRLLLWLLPLYADLASSSLLMRSLAAVASLAAAADHIHVDTHPSPILHNAAEAAALLSIARSRPTSRITVGMYVPHRMPLGRA